MAKKGKYKLLSYLIEDYLVYYKSFNRSKKLYAFCIFKISNQNQIFAKLNTFLKKGFFSYYSVQINIVNGKVEAILCFKANEKSKVIELFGITYHKLIEYNNKLTFYKGKKLEDEFLKIIIKNNKSNIRIYKKEKTFFLKNHGYEKAMDIYKISFKINENNDQVIVHLIKLIKNLDQKGYLILNFRNIDNDIALNSYFIHNVNEILKNNVNFKEEINNFFNFNLLKKIEINLTEIYRILWRLNLKENFFPFNKINKFFFLEHNLRIKNIQEFNLKFEKSLKSNNIEYQRLNRNLIFIEQKIIFITLFKLNFKLILKIFKRFFSKYLIYLLILDDYEYYKLMKIDKIKLLEGLVILNYQDFIHINMKNLKK